MASYQQLPRAAAHDPEAARRGAAPARGPEPRRRRAAAHGERAFLGRCARGRGHQALYDAARGVSRTTSTTTRCSTSSRAPTTPPASRIRRCIPSISSCSAIPTPRTSTRCSSGAASCSSPPAATPRREQAYAAVIARGASVALLRAEPLQARLVALQGGAAGAEPADVRQAARLRAAGAGGTRAAADRLRRADRELVDDSLRVMSITFSEDSGAQSIERFVGRYGARPYDALLYSRLGDLYVTKQRYQDAASTYLAYVDAIRNRMRRRISRRGPSGRIPREASASSSSRRSGTTSSTMDSSPLIGARTRGPITLKSLAELETDLQGCRDLRPCDGPAHPRCA